MKAPIKSPINDTQRSFNELCEKGGGVRGGPARTKVLQLVRDGGQGLNRGAFREMADALSACPGANPWHVCFAMGLCWGHLAQMETTFIKAAVRVLEKWSHSDLEEAKSFCMERGAGPIEDSLIGARLLFDKVALPQALPSTLQQLALEKMFELYTRMTATSAAKLPRQAKS